MADLLHFDSYVILLLVGGVAALGAGILPRLLSNRPLSFPIIYVAAGLLLFLAVPALTPPNVFEQGLMIERITEFGVIVSLMGAGLKIDRPVGWHSWQTTWRLLAITMPLSILLAAILGWWVIGFAPATALLLGAVIAPTDPVLAADVQVGPPGEGHEHDVRFALTSEAGLNDALAFPFTNAAIALLVVGGVSWVGEWLLVDVVYKLAVGLAMGWLVGRLLGRLVFSHQSETRLASHSEGFIALAATLVSYAATEVVGGYGFLAVFVAAITLRSAEHDDRYHEVLHDFAEQVERLVAVGLLVGLGAAVAGGLLRSLTWQGALVAVLLILVVRPLSGWLAMLGTTLPRGERAVVAFFGIRGVGSVYYLAHALEQAEFQQTGLLWSVVVLVILLSVMVHGISVSPIMRRVDP